MPGLDRDRFRIGGESMGTVWSLDYYGNREQSPEVVRAAILRAYGSVIAEMSHWDIDSALSRYNRAPASSWFAMPDGMAFVVDAALEAALDSHGAFDPTLGALVSRYGFGPPGSPTQGPSGFRHLRRDGKSLWQPGGLQLDLSAIAKGYAVDLAARSLGGLGINSYLLELGGELRGEGVKPGGEPWWVSLERPAGGETPGFPEVLVGLCGLSIATSGDYRRQAMHEGRIVSHTIDPRTQEPIANGIVSATVIHPECIWADAYATAIGVLGWDSGLAFAEERNLAALLVRRSAQSYEYSISPAFRAMLE
jgi:thiamine biosynthesis lipoprotein